MTIRPIRFLLCCLSLIFIVSSCKRINEATDLGSEVIPGADGVNTYDTTFTSLQTYNHIFDPLNDSVRIGFNNDQILGNISGDPLFGETNAKMFLQLKPETYPWSFSGIYKQDSLYIDSVVLVLGYSGGNYGDTVASQKVTVKEIDPLSDFRVDSFYTIYDPGPSTTTVLGTKTFSPQNLKDSVKVYQDTTAGQLRIRLDNSFGQRLLNYDTTNAYANDSLFSTYFKGFAIEADQSIGNALMAFNIYNNPNTNLAIYYRYTKGGQDDTTVSYFLFKPGFSAYHNHVKRDFSGTELLTNSNPPEAVDDRIYLINTPGSYATVKIPALKDLSNRIINRAELIVEQVYDPSNATFTHPFALMLDVYDSTLGDYKFVPYDFLPELQQGAGIPIGIPNVPFGLYGKNTVDIAGNPIRVWKFNLTRYVQNVLTKQEPLHDLRLYITKDAIGRVKQGVISNTGGYQYINVAVNPYYAFGRVKVGGGKHPTQTMRLRLVYTKI